MLRPVVLTSTMCVAAICHAQESPTTQSKPTPEQTSSVPAKNKAVPKPQPMPKSERKPAAESENDSADERAADEAKAKESAAKPADTEKKKVVARKLTEEEQTLIRVAIAELDSEDFKTRAAAQRQLMNFNEAAGPLLLAALPDATLEQRMRLFSVLESYYLNTDPLYEFVVSEALESMAASDNISLRRGADQILLRQPEMRARIAQRAFEDLGGHVVEFVPFRDQRLGSSSQSPYLRIGGDWKGGDDGLKHVIRLDLAASVPSTRAFTVYVIDGVDISENAKRALQRHLGDRYSQRSQASLGISWSPISMVETGCEVNQVVATGAAAAAGIQPGDVILKLDGVKIDSFEDLIGKLKKYRPRQKVVLRILRANRERDVDVVLKEWGER